MKKHHTFTKARGDLWDAHRTDRDRTCEKVELGVRVWEAMNLPVRPFQTRV